RRPRRPDRRRDPTARSRVPDPGFPRTPLPTRRGAARELQGWREREARPARRAKRQRRRGGGGRSGVAAGGGAAAPARAGVRRGDKVSGLQELRRASQLAPGLVEAQRELGRLAVEAKDWPTAVAAFTAVLVWEPAASASRAETQRALAGALDAQNKARAASR